MPYCFLEYRPAGDAAAVGLVPDCPDDLAFLLLADHPQADWGLFEVDVHDAWSPETPVPDDLAGLIESAKRYPPALALAREEPAQVFPDGCPDRPTLVRAYVSALRHHLGAQHEASYVMAPSVRDEPGVLVKGEWYWVLEVAGQPPRAVWVTDDYCVARTDVADFDLTGAQLKRLGYAG